MQGRGAGERCSEENHAIEIFMRSVRVNLKLWIQGRVGTPEPPDFRTYTEPFSLFLKSVSVVRNGP